MRVRKAIEDGNSDQAIEQVSDLNPQILEEHPELLFRLKKQHFIELVREGKMEEALQFAEEELAHRVENNHQLLQELEESMTLLMFESPEASPMARLMKLGHREKTASELNAAILHSESQAGAAKLPSLIKLMLWCQNRLSGFASYPALPVKAKADLMKLSAAVGGNDGGDMHQEEEEEEEEEEEDHDEPMPDVVEGLLRT